MHKNKSNFLVTSLLPSYLMEQKYYTIIYKNIHYVQFRLNNKTLYKFIVKTFTIYSLGKNTVNSMENTIFFDNTIAKEYVQLYFVCNKVSFYLSTCRS